MPIKEIEEEVNPTGYGAILKREVVIRRVWGIDYLNKKVLVSIAGNYEWHPWKKLLKCVMYDEAKEYIYEDETVFEFDYLQDLHTTIKLKGIFRWHSDELRFEVEVLDNATYTVLSFSDIVMSNFTIIN